jgi:signal transduction histidine kinase
MTLRVRLLSLTLSMVAVVALTLTALSVNNLTALSIDVAIGNSEMAARQMQSFLMRKLADAVERAPRPADAEAAKKLWRETVRSDRDIAALLEQMMAQSRSIIEIGIAGEDGVILASSNPRQAGAPMVSRQDLRAVRETGPLGRMTAILAAHNDYETRQPMGVAGQKTPLFTIQALVSPVLLRANILPAVRDAAIASGLALAAAICFAYWASRLALRPLERVERLIDDVASGEAPQHQGRAEEERELAVIQSKLSILGERYRGAREDASHLRANLEDVLGKLDEGARKRLTDQIALSQRLAAINSLTGRVAHEIKNPLNAITLRLEILRERIAAESPEALEEFAVLSEEITRLDRVVRTFLDFSRPVEVQVETVDAREMVAEILRLLEPEAETHGVKLTLDEPEGAALVKADPDLLRQALLNIAVNAIEAMPQGGELRVEGGRRGDSCWIQIADTGPGIPPDQLDEIFQLYFTTKEHGTGIGLAMTYRAVQLQGGAIEVESEVGKGTRFRVTLPAAEDAGTL